MVAQATDGDFEPAVVLDAMKFAAYLTAAISRISLHIQAEIHMDRRARLVNHLRPDRGLPGIPSFTKRKLLELTLDTDTMFAGQFDEVLKETTTTHAVAFQASQRSQLSPRARALLGNAPGGAALRRSPSSSSISSAKLRPPRPRLRKKNCSNAQASLPPGRGRGRSGVEPGLVGGCLRKFAGAWEDITSDKWVLQTVLSGYRVEFTESVRLTRAPLWTRILAKHKHRVALEEGLHKMLLKKAIIQLNTSLIGPGFFSSLFLVEKRSGGWLAILNLKRLSEGVKPPKFKMDTLQSVLNTLGTEIQLYREVPGPWAVSFDLQDTYFHVAVDPKDRKFLRFAYNGEGFRIPVAPIWSIERSQNIHTSGQGDRSVPQDARDQRFPVSR